MSKHDRGAFGALLAEAKEMGCSKMGFDCYLNEDAESGSRWYVEGGDHFAFGRTGEEALRRLVEALRIAREPKRG